MCCFHGPRDDSAGGVEKTWGEKRGIGTQEQFFPIKFVGQFGRVPGIVERIERQFMDTVFESLGHFS